MATTAKTKATKAADRKTHRRASDTGATDAIALLEAD